nr:glycosyltransferase family 2 protein [Sedimentibacter sp.]
MYISQCLIVKNEEKNIEYCLSHLKSVVDEQVVVDTGSTDRTVEIAEKLGAKIFHFDWIDDFSAARNFALQKAKGDWIIFLDCDEYFSADSVPLIKKAIIECSKNKNTDGIVCELINIDGDKKVLSTAKNVSARIFKNKKSIKYKNRIHEVLYNEKRPNINYLLAAKDYGKHIKIYHTGYDQEVMREKDKSRKYIDMLKKELEENPQNSHTFLYISISLYMEGEYKESLEYARQSLKYVELDKNSAMYHSSIYSTILNNMLYLGTPYEEMKEVFDEASNTFPRYPDYYRAIAAANLKNGNTKSAIEFYSKCINLCNTYSSPVESLTVGQVNEVYKDMLTACIADDNRPKIVEIAVALLKAQKYDYEILTILIKTFLTQEKEENIVQFLTKLYDYNDFKDKIYLLKASQATNNESLIGFYKSLLSEEQLKIVEG